jgi:hypothetical protein
MSKLNLITFILLFSIVSFAQTETLTNSQIIEMSKVGLGARIIITKIEKSKGGFDTSANALIELKKSGVDDEVIAAIIEKSAANSESLPTNTAEKTYSESTPSSEKAQFSDKIQAPRDALQSARTIAFVKSSIQPSRQALEKELLKRKDWQSLNLTIERYKDKADLYVEIGYVSLSWLTHRYVYRVYDRRSGAVLAAGETTSWGSLAENLARHIAKSLSQIAADVPK